MPDEAGPNKRPAGPTGVRLAPLWASLRDLAAEQSAALGRPLRVLDLGGGSGGLAVPLAAAGHEVVVVDPSPDALASLRRRAAESDVDSRLAAHQGDADSLGEILAGAQPDLVCCHGTLEHVDDPQLTLERLAQVLAPRGTLSLVAANRLAAVLSRALGGHFEQAAHVLTSADGRWGEGDPMPRRFDRQGLVDLVGATGLRVVQAQPVRLFSDLVPSSFLDTDAERAALLALESAASEHPAFAALGSAVHVLARRD